MRDLIVSQLTGLRDTMSWFGFTLLANAMTKILNNVSLIDLVVEVIEGKIGNDPLAVRSMSFDAMTMDASDLSAKQLATMQAVSIDWATLWPMIQMILKMFFGVSTAAAEVEAQLVAASSEEPCEGEATLKGKSKKS